MNRRLFLATALTGLLTACFVTAQEAQVPKIPVTLDGVTGQVSQGGLIEVRLAQDPAALERQMAEDIAIMCRILDRTLQRAGGGSALRKAWDRHLLDVTGTRPRDGTVRLWDVTTGKQANKVVATLEYDGDTDLTIAQGCPGQVHSFPEMQGVYLKDYGVVFTAISPLLFQQPRPGAAPPAKQPLSEWERVRKEMRGEKAEVEKAAEPGEPSLADVVLNALAENGHNFRQLTNPNERITVAITFRLSQSCTQCHASQAEPWKASTSKGEPAKSDASSTLFQVLTVDKSAEEKLTARALVGRLAEAQGKALDAENYALLADLHVKQGKYDEAVQAYQKALQLKPSAELYSKLAQAYLAVSDKAKARSALEKAQEALSQALAAESKPAPPAAAVPAQALPAQLIISAPKTLLDRVGAGKMSMEEFKKAATVQSVNFAAALKEAPRPVEKGKVANPEKPH